VPSGGGPFPLVVWVHGGGWHAAGKDSCFELCRPFLNHGFACASLDYRWTWDAPFPAQIEDCNDAIAWLRANAAQYHLDPNEVGLIGHSAGAHLCALIAATGDSTTFKDPQKVQAAVCLSGIYDMDRARGQWPADSLMTRPHDVIDTFFPTGTYDTAFARYASPESYVHPGIPPLLIFHGSLDSIVPIAQAQVFAEDLTKAGVDATFRIGIGQTHGSVLSPDNMAATVSFFEQHLRQHADP
jgi:acetyl esterase/lipase